MKISYIAHASLLFETDECTVVTDPWYHGPAYYNQWHVFPKPVDTNFTDKVTHVILTHGHEDHFHPPTLQCINKKAQVYFPYVWKGGTVKAIKDLGFKEVFEVPNFNTVVLGENFTVTYLLSGMDAFTVYEYNGMVILNLNDALNVMHKNFIFMFSSIIKQKWPVIDYMICGLGGAGYFPNTVHTPLKNDKEIGMLREQFLAHKFCELVSAIKPLNVIPFVPGFALLEKGKAWINEMKFPRNDLEQYYLDNFNASSKIKFHNVLPGDHIENNIWIKASPYHKDLVNDNLNHLVSTQYAKEIKACNTFENQPASFVNELSRGLNNILPVSTSGISNNLLRKIDLAIAFSDVKYERYIHLYFNGQQLVAEPEEKLPPKAKLKITTHTWKLDFAIKEEWGGDVFFIGYGADIDIIDKSCLEYNLDIISLRLLSRFPSASYNMIREPFRAIKYLSNNMEFTALAIKQKFTTGKEANKLPYSERSHWINKSKSDVCRLCDIPLLSDEFGEALGFA